LDYDGTIARNDRLDPDVLDAIGIARRRGVTVLLVTGRVLGDLRRVAGELRFVDGVVAENGAVVHFPDSGHTTVLAPLVSRAFVSRLEEDGIPFQSGQCYAKTAAEAGAAMMGLEKYVHQAGFDRGLLELVRLRASLINGT
jgi:hypothetical protein